MVDEIFIRATDGVLQVAQIAEGRLVALQAARLDKQKDSSLQGCVYLGRVVRVVERLQAAFVDVGLERDGFLAVRDARVLAEDSKDRDTDTLIEDCVQDGDTVLVQLTKPPSGDKGAQITADVTLPGRAVVLAPCRTRIAVSRAIADEAERERLAELAKEICGAEGEEGVSLEGADGWVIRTAAVNMSRAELLADMQNLTAQWEALLQRAETAEPPTLLHEDLGPLERALRDLVNADTKSVVIEGEAAFREAVGYCRASLPAVESLLSAAEAENLFDRHDVAAQLEAALSPRFELSSGGWLMIETTEAMTTIDVNSGSDERGTLATNLEAAAAIGRQVPLRGLGGLLAIDFIDMTAEADKEQVMEALDTAFAGDRNRVRIGPMSEFCVVELTRRRPPLTLAQSMRLARQPSE